MAAGTEGRELQSSPGGTEVDVEVEGENRAAGLVAAGWVEVFPVQRNSISIWALEGENRPESKPWT